MKKIHLMFVLGTLEIGGTERQFLELVSRLDQKTFDIEVVSFSSHGPVRDALDALNIPLTPLGFSAPRGRRHPDSFLRVIRVFFRLVGLFRQQRPDIVQSYLPGANMFAAPAARLAGVPVMITGRRTAAPDERFLSVPQFPEQWLQECSNLWATAVLANSEHAGLHCVRSERFLMPEKVYVIHNGIDCARYQASPDIAQQRKALGLPERGAIVGMPAAFTPCKGHEDLIRAAEHVLQHSPDTLFLLVGRDAGIQKKLESLVRRLGIHRSVIFLGERRDIPDILAIFDIQISSSYIEGLSNAVLEGMSAGKALVATRIPGNMELLEHERTGLLVPPGDANALASAIIDLLKTPEKRKILGEAARRKAETEFRMEKMLEKTATLYMQLITGIDFSRLGTTRKK